MQPSHAFCRLATATLACRTLSLATFIAVCTAGSAHAQLRVAPRGAIDQLRNEMVDREIVAAGVKNPRVIQAMRSTPRHEFMPAAERANAYFDMALPIGKGQTISPPFIVAFMTESIDPQPTDRVLEIGTGSGYQAAVLSPLVQDVYSIEIVEALGQKAARTLKRLKYENVFTKVGDGFQGWPEHAPFDKIIVTCSPENVPPALVEQLAEGGLMVIPLGERYRQTLYLMRKSNGKLQREALEPTLFVPMTGAAEAKREIRPDPAHPAIFNGGFEELDADTKTPVGWHYQRQVAVETAAPPQGKTYLRFSNGQAGRGSQALQGLGIDGRQVHEIELSAQVTAKNVRPGQSAQQLPVIYLTFYDEQRETVGEDGLGPWNGTFDWQPFRAKIRVPVKTREAVLRIGLMGAVGELGLDDLKLEAVPAK